MDTFLKWVCRGLLVLSLAGGARADTAVAADSSAEAGVPFFQALADAQQVVDLNTGWKVYLLRGDSMIPQLEHDSLLLVAKADFDQLAPRMLVVYRDHTGDLVVHRLIARARGGWIAKGINNDQVDPGLVTRDNFQGLVSGTMRYQAGTDNLTAITPARRPPVAYAKKY